MRLTRDDTVLVADGKEIARLYIVKGVETVCAPLWGDDDTWPAIPWNGDLSELARFLTANPLICRQCLGSVVAAAGGFFCDAGRYVRAEERSDALKWADELMEMAAFWRGLANEVTHE